MLDFLGSAMTRSTPPATYDDDFFTWTQDQAAALRAGLQAEVDVEHVAEEIADLGKRDLREVTSYLELVLVHLLKLEAEPNAPSVPHWRAETRAFARSAVKAFSPGMMQRIDLPNLWEEVTGSVAVDRRDLGLAPPSARLCPFVPADLLTRTLDVDGALSKLANASRSS